MTTFSKVKTVDKTNLQPGYLIHVDFSFYSFTSIRGFASMLTVICAKTILLWVFLTASKRVLLSSISSILTTFKNEQHPCKRVRVDEYFTLANSTDVANLLVDYLNISM